MAGGERCEYARRGIHRCKGRFSDKQSVKHHSGQGAESHVLGQLQGVIKTQAEKETESILRATVSPCCCSSSDMCLYCSV